METTATKEHEWLQKFLGEWKATGESPIGPDQAPMTWTTTETGRLIGPLWMQAESQSTMPDGKPATMQLTLGYDTKQKKFVGSWIGSMMDYLWIYEGELSADGKTLTLSANGPSMSTPGTIVGYRDIHRFVNDSHRILTSNMQDENGEWQQFMEVHYYRQ
ncbi:MAG: DUF1579 domain-containing protein [Moraxellaceae bacterium]